MAKLKLVPPNPKIKERITAFGHAGAGKSSLIYQILTHHKDANAYVIDMDYSFAHERLIQTEYPELEDRVNIATIDTDWVEFGKVMDDALKHGDEDDWLVIDPGTATWQAVQSWFSTQVHGSDIGAHMMRLKKETKDIKEFNKELSSDMTWPVINKLYIEGFYSKYRKWRGHVLVICEAAAVRKDADAAEKAEFGFLGQKPSGQKQIPYIGATNIYLDHSGKTTWRFTTTKDRGRPLVEKVEFDANDPMDNFAIKYLEEVAGWDWEPVR